MASRPRLARTDSQVHLLGLGETGRQRRAFPVTGPVPGRLSSETPSASHVVDPVSPSAGSRGTTVRRNKGPRPPANLSKEVLLACTSVVRKKGEKDEEYLRRLTHLQLQGMRLGPSLTKLQLVSGVCVLYAYDNLISSLEGFDILRRLQQLYLQNNRLTSLVGLEGLATLKKLHVGNNAIATIDGLTGCHSLEELHVPSQRLPGEESLQFCPKTIESLASTLLVLNAAGNRIQDASCLEPLHLLQSLDLADNDLNEVQNISALLSAAPGLVRVQLHGNILAIQERRYRHTIVLLAPAIEEIDGKAVLPQERDFVRRLEEQKRKIQMQRERHLVKHGQMQVGVMHMQLGVTPSEAPDIAVQSDPKRMPPVGLELSATPPVLQDLVH